MENSRDVQIWTIFPLLVRYSVIADGRKMCLLFGPRAFFFNSRYINYGSVTYGSLAILR